MLKFLKRPLSILLCFILFVTTFSVGFTAVAATTQQQVQNEIEQLKKEAAELDKDIKNLKNQKANQQAILNAINKKIANTQAQIRACNNNIASINTKIANNKAEIAKNQKEISETKLEFQKRLRAIYMSNSDSQVKILLGANDFAEYLQLAQMTATVSAHDKTIIEKIADAVKALEAKNKENEELIKQQVSARSVIEASQRELQKDEDEAQKIYNRINADQAAVQKDKNQVLAEIKEKQDYLDSFNKPSSGTTGGNFINNKTGFYWPVPGHRNITSGWGERWGTFHYGLDISTGSIYGKPIVAITDGVVYRMHTACTHRTRSSRCRCGNGWGNHIGLEHGRIGGYEYRAMYAHMDTVASGMYVGKKVKQGQTIGYVGTTGDSTGYHLHFGLSRRAAGSKGSFSWINPYSYVW